MKKRLFSMFLAALMLTSSSVVAMAAKKETEIEVVGGKTNIYQEISSLDTEGQVKAILSSYGTVSLDTSNAVSGNGCLKFVGTNGANAGLRLPITMYKGETYDISFDVKSDGPTNYFTVTMFFQNNPYSYRKIKEIANGVSSTWQRHTISYTWDGTTNNPIYNDIGEGNIGLIYGTDYAPSAHTMYIDNISVVPRGNVPNAEYPVVKPITNLASWNKWPDSINTEDYGVEAPKTTGQKSFADVKGHWAEQTINTLASCDYIDGVDANNYLPNTKLTRAQFVKMVVDTLNLTHPAYTANYNDVKGDEWYAPYLQIATNLGLLDPALTFGNYFYPDRPITREEAASIAVKVAVLKGATKAENSISFADEADISVWAKTAVENAAAYELINGYETGKFLPKNTITRAEAAQILYRVAAISTIFDIYVDSEAGNDKNDGSVKAPLKTVQAARDMVRKFNDDMKNDIYIRIKGEQQMASALQLGPEDSGSNGYAIVYTSWGDEKATLSTGKDYSGFSLHDAEKNIYKIYIGTGMTTRQAWFNGTRGILARTISGFSEDCVWKERPKTYISSDRWLLDVPENELQQIEMWYHNNYLMPMAKIGSVEEQEDGRVLIIPEAKGWDTSDASIIRWPNQPQEYPAFLANAYQFLSHPGEYYISKEQGYLYYIPRDGEDMDSMVLTLPIGEKVIEARGSSKDEPVHNLRFENLILKENDWTAVHNSICFCGGQNMNQANLGQGWIMDHAIPAAFDVMYGWYVDILNCKVTKSGTKGISYGMGSKYCNIIGNEVSDVAMNGVIIGSIQALSDPVTYSENIKFNNNYIHDNGYDHTICAAVSMNHAKNTEFLHNTITNTPYSGLCLGFGADGGRYYGFYTTNYEVAYNFINETTNTETFDGGSIYTFCNQMLPFDTIQSTVHHNYVKNNRNAYSFLYLDQGTTSTHWYENVVDARDVYGYEYSHLNNANTTKNVPYTITYYANITDNIVENNYSTTGTTMYHQKAPTLNTFGDVFVYPDANWPAEAQKTVDEAGVEPEYQDNFDFSGPKYFIAKRREYELAANQSMQLQVEVAGLHNEKYPLSAGNVHFEVSDPEALTIDENGVATSTGKTARVWVLASAEIDGIVTTKKLFINTADGPERADMNLAQLNMLNGFTASLPIKITSSSGRNLGGPDEVTIVSSDPSLVSVDNSTVSVTALKEGSAVLTVTATKDGVPFVMELPITVVNSFTNEEATKLPYINLSTNSLSWANGANDLAGGGIKVTGNPAYYADMDNQLLAFDMVVNAGGGWPSIMFCADDKMKVGLTSQTMYLICFLPDFIEVQRFVNGEQTYFFGDDASLNPIVGPGIQNYNREIYEYDGKPISVVAGAIQAENGTRLILNVNGKNLLDYTDTDKNAIPPKGIFGVFTQGAGAITFYPYSGRTN